MNIHLTFVAILGMSSVLMPPAAAQVRSSVQTQSDAEAEQRATDIRDQSVEDWRAGNYAAAADKLETALAIYAELPGEYLEESSVVLRAISWNRLSAGDLPAAWSAFDRLSRLRSKSMLTKGLTDELDSAYGAIYAGAAREESVEDGIAWLEKAYRRARALKLDALRAQVRHDQGSLAAGTTMKRRAVTRLFDEALSLRTKSGDELGATWTRNGLGRFLFDRGLLDEACEPLLDAYRAVVEDRVAQPQFAVAGNVERLLEAALAADEVSNVMADAARALAAIGATKTDPRVLTLDRVQWLGAQLEARRRGRHAAVDAAQHLIASSSSGQPPVVRADKTLHAAELAAQDDPSLALGWLQAMPELAGPAAPLLDARRAKWTAITSAATGDAAGFDRAAKDAMQRYLELDYLYTEQPAIEALVAAGQQAAGSQQLAALEARLKKLKHTGRPGGRGGAVSFEDISERIGELGLLDPVFEIRATEEGLVIVDLLGGAEYPTDTSWQPHNLTFNGLGLRVEGGFVSVLSMNYGNSSGTRGGRGDGSKDLEIGFHPLPAKGALVVAKNGAIAYR